VYTKLNFLYLNELKKVDELIDPITEHWDIPAANIYRGGCPNDSIHTSTPGDG